MCVIIFHRTNRFNFTDVCSCSCATHLVSHFSLVLFSFRCTYLWLAIYIGKRLRTASSMCVWKMRVYVVHLGLPISLWFFLLLPLFSQFLLFSQFSLLSCTAVAAHLNSIPTPSEFLYCVSFMYLEFLVIQAFCISGNIRVLHLFECQWLDTLCHDVVLFSVYSMLLMTALLLFEVCTPLTQCSHWACKVS